MLSVVITLIVIGILLWLVNAYIPMDAKIKNILNIVVVICVVLWLLSVFGVFDYVSSVTIIPLTHVECSNCGFRSKGPLFRDD